LEIISITNRALFKYQFPIIMKDCVISEVAGTNKVLVKLTCGHNVIVPKSVLQFVDESTECKNCMCGHTINNDKKNK
jgi:hypothetical protein